MKSYLHAWFRGIGVLGLNFCLSLVVVGVGAIAEALPERFRILVGLPVFVVAVPPMLFWTLRWLYPELATSKSRLSQSSSQARPEGTR